MQAPEDYDFCFYMAAGGVRGRSMHVFTVGAESGRL